MHQYFSANHIRSRNVNTAHELQTVYRVHTELESGFRNFQDLLCALCRAVYVHCG